MRLKLRFKTVSIGSPELVLCFIVEVLTIYLKSRDRYDEAYPHI